SPCFLKKPAFCPSSEKEFSHVPASPPAMRNLSCATAVQFKPATSANTGIANLRLGLIMSRPPLHDSDPTRSARAYHAHWRSCAGFPAVAILATHIRSGNAGILVLDAR